MRDAAVRLADGRGVNELVIEFTTLARIAQLTVPRFAARQREQHAVGVCIGCVAGLQYPPILPDRLFAAEPADAHEGVVEVLDAACRIADADAQRALLDGHRQLAQLLLSRMPFGDVVE